MRGSARNAAFFANNKAPIANNNTNSSSNIVSVSSLAQLINVSRSSGALNLSNQNISILPDLHDTTLYPIEKFWECLPLAKLDASYNILNQFQSLECYEQLMTLLLRGNKIDSIVFDQLNNLQVLDLSSNILITLDDSIGLLLSLRILYLSDNHLQHLPDSLCACINIQELNLSGNKLIEIPENIGNIRALRKLNLAKNRLEFLPASINDLGYLEILDISKNKINRLPILSGLNSLVLLNASENNIDILCPLPSNGRLSIIQLSYNNIQEFDMTILFGCQESMSELHVNNNKLRSIPEEVAVLINLKVLDVSNNDITEIPPSFGYLKQLHRIALDGNPIRSIRRSLLSQSTDDLKKFLRSRGPAYANTTSTFSNNYDDDIPANMNHIVLNKARDSLGGVLDLSNMNLHELPPDIFYSLGMPFISTLHSFHLHHNKFINFPIEELSIVPYLKSVDISFNSLGDTNLDILKSTALPCMSILNISGNKLTSYHIYIILQSLLRNNNYISSPLISCNLSQNMISDVPENLIQHQLLREINLSQNKMSILNIDFRNMSRLEVLILDDNRLTSLGNLEKAANLKVLSIQNNNFQEIPPKICLLPRLTTLSIHNNPQRSIPYPIIEQGTEAILNILRKRLPDTILKMSENPVIFGSHIDSSISRKTNYDVGDTSDNISRMPTKSKEVSSSSSFKSSVSHQGESIEDLHMKLQNTQRDIVRLEAESENFSTTQTRRQEIRRDLNRKRADASQMRGKLDDVCY